TRPPGKRAGRSRDDRGRGRRGRRPWSRADGRPGRGLGAAGRESGQDGSGGPFALGPGRPALMRKTVSAPFAAYRLAWRLLLPAVRLLVAADAGIARVPGRGIIPGRWRAAARLGYGWGGGGCGCGGTIWFHCASLGEANGLWALVSALGGSGDVLVTANTAEGAAYLEERCAVGRAAVARVPAQRPAGTSRSIRACVAPFDHPGLVRRFLEVHRVRGLCLYEAELWPHYLAACREAGVPAALVSGRLSPRAFRAYRGFAGAASSLLEGLAFIDRQSVV